VLLAHENSDFKTPIVHSKLKMANVADGEKY